MNELIATIHFIGLCLFTTVASTDAKLHVVLPRIQSTGMERQQRGAVATPRPRAGLAGVENHTAFLSYKDSDFVNVAGWTPQKLPHQTGFSYIVLTGEAISFYTNQPNDPTTAAPPDLPKGNCCTSQTLRAAFHAADGSGAAAIVRVPQGTLTACGSRPGGGADPNPRVDTKLKLTNSGVLVVVGTTKQQSRSLILKGGATLYVANLPSQWVSNVTYVHVHGSVKHNAVYPAMFDHGTSTCPYYAPAPVSVSDCYAADGFRFGDTTMPPQLGEIKKTYDDKGMAINSDCSNSSWP